MMNKTSFQLTDKKMKPQTIIVIKYKNNSKKFLYWSGKTLILLPEISNLTPTNLNFKFEFENATISYYLLSQNESIVQLFFENCRNKTFQDILTKIKNCAKKFIDATDKYDRRFPCI